VGNPVCNRNRFVQDILRRWSRNREGSRITLQSPEVQAPLSLQKLNPYSGRLRPKVISIIQDLTLSTRFPFTRSPSYTHRTNFTSRDALQVSCLKHRIAMIYDQRYMAVDMLWITIYCKLCFLLVGGPRDALVGKSGG
jgi:hypothetical protein